MGGTYKYDVSIPHAQWCQLVGDCKDRLKQLGLFSDSATVSHEVNAVLGYGHFADGNLHLNISVQQYHQDIEEALEPWIYEWIQRHNASISAEHGLGLAKKPFVNYHRMTPT